MLEFQQTINDCIHRLRFSKKICIVDEDSIEYSGNDIYEYVVAFIDYIQQFSEIHDNGAICVSMQNSFAYIISIISLSIMGITFVPVPIGFPNKRKRKIYSDSNCSFMICINEDDNFNCITWNNFLKYKISNKLENELTFDIGIRIEKPMYILYTSGTTTAPKGVVISRQAFLSFLTNFSKTLIFTEYDSILFHTSIGFDISLLEIFLPIIQNFKIIISPNISKNPRKLLLYLYDKDITIFQATPSLLSLLLIMNDKKLFSKIKYLLVGGEDFPVSLLKETKKLIEGKIYNLYGPTETTIWVTISELTNKNRIDLGKAIPGNEIFIVNESNSVITDVYTTGEIYIKGGQLSSGYINNEYETKKHFEIFDSDLVYKTGDFAEYDNEKRLIFKGRKDTQVKLNGNRIDLLEIEHTINSYYKINQSIVFLVKDKCKKIKVIFTTKESFEIDELIVYLRKRLPSYMIPVIFEKCDTIRKNDRNKIDRKYYVNNSR